MDWMTEILTALDTGADRVLDAAVVYAGLWLTCGLLFAKKSALARVPAMFHVIVAGLIESYLQPIAENAVRQAEEWAERTIDAGLATAGTLGPEKVARAKAYVLARVPDWIISDDRLSGLIDAALVSVGHGAAGAIRITADAVVTEIEAAPGPRAV